MEDRMSDFSQGCILGVIVGFLAAVAIALIWAGDDA